MIAEIATLAAGRRKAAGPGSEMIVNVATATQSLIFDGTLATIASEAIRN
jgi:hypothetical protein